MRLSNLDAKLREETRVELRELVKRLEITTVYVTHDQIEALTMSDVVAVMEKGVIVQESSPLDIYQNPNSRFVASFIGASNFLEGRVAAAAGEAGLGEVETASGRLICKLPEGAKPGDAVSVAARPEDVRLLVDGAQGAGNVLEGRIGSVVFMGESKECQVRLAKDVLLVRVHPGAAVEEGQTVRVALEPEKCRAFRD